MFMSASSEFIALAREQMALLAQGLGATLSILYLAQELVEAQAGETKLIPVVVYPETPLLRQPDENTFDDLSKIDSVTVESGEVRLSSSTNVYKGKGKSRLGGKTLILPNVKQRLLAAGEDLASHKSPFTSNDIKTSSLPSMQNEFLLDCNQMVLPLIHEGMMMGVLVTNRSEQAWSQQERNEIERVAQTLALAYILDRRRAWLQQQLHSSQILQEKQRDLLDNLLHQFRNPLTALRTFGKLLIKRLGVADANRDVAASIVRESDRLQELLQKFDEVIDLTTDDLALVLPPSSEVVITPSVQKAPKQALLLPGYDETETDCYLADILLPLLESAKAIAQERKLELIIEVPETKTQIRANTKSLREVLNNIIDNALKYTPAGGKVLVQAGQQKTKDKVNLQGVAISDTGPGIPVGDLEHIGERHYRGVQAQTEIPGTGLGLAIAKQLIEEMQGEMEIFSPALKSIIQLPDQQGTTFIIWLPEVNSQ
jgi:signal transduction histidine kinase